MVEPWWFDVVSESLPLLVIIAVVVVFASCGGFDE
jgi:hypothetical protein